MSLQGQEPRFWMDALTPSSLGTGVTRTTLNNGNAYSMSAKVGALVEVVPELVETGAHTAAESFMVRSVTSSDSLPNLVPKQFVFSGSMGGLGVFAFTNVPMLQSYVFNSAMRYQATNITFEGECQIANTVAPEMSLTLVLTDGGPMGPEQFYTAPANETNTGTSQGETAGNDITINGGRTINQVYCILTPGVITASEDIHGRGTISSSNFKGVPSPQRFHAQPIAAGLGTAVSVAIPGDRRWKTNIPIENSFVANTSFLLDEALTATGNFIVGVGYLK